MKKWNGKKLLTGVLAAAMVMSLLAGCSKAGTNNTDGGSGGNTTGSGTETGAAGSVNTETTGAGSGSGTVSGSVSTNGSTSMESVIGILSEEFMNANQGVTITYDPTGSGTGIEAVNTGACDIGLASRDLKAEEIEKGLVSATLALDGIAVIVNESNPIGDLTVEDIQAIFTGEVTDWSQYGSDAGAIACVGRESGSGTRDGFETITGTTDLCVLTQELTSTGAVIEAVKSSANAIGYASFASVEGQEGIRVLTVGGVACNAENIANGSYVIQRPFNLITKDGVALSEAAQAFYDYMTSADAAAAITQAGAVPVSK